MTLLARFAPWFLIVAAVGYLYWQNESKGAEIVTLKANIVSQRAYLEDKVKKVEFNVVTKLKKKHVEETIKYDDSKSVDLNSTFIYY